MQASDAAGIYPSAEGRRPLEIADGFDTPSFTEISDPGRLAGSPSVSVLMLVHNHASYLAEAIEGVLAQACEFPYELLIGEDASHDGSLAIALRYQQRHPEIVRVIRWHANVGMNANQRQLFALARGEFLAYCEGDDYWCHPGKLVGQRALLQSHPAAGCVHADWVRAKPVKAGFRINWHKSMHRRVPPSLLQGDLFHVFNFPKILRTCTLMQRRSAVEAFHASELSIPDYRFVDTVRSSYISSRWPVLYWPEIAAVYRESPGSVLRSGMSAFLGYLRSSLQFDDDARRFFAGRSDYPWNYRWECAIGLLLRGLRSADATTLAEALQDLRRHGVMTFMRAAVTAIRIRWPTLRPNLRKVPMAAGAAPKAAAIQGGAQRFGGFFHQSLRQLAGTSHSRSTQQLQHDPISPT